MPDSTPPRPWIVTAAWHAAFLLLLPSARLDAEEPVVLRPEFRIADAPEIALTDHGITGQDVRVQETLLGPGETDAPALYLFCNPAYHRRDAEERLLGRPLWGSGRDSKAKRGDPEKDGTPVIVIVDFGTGQTREIFPSAESYFPPLQSAGGLGKRSDPARQRLSGWPWDRPVVAAAADSRLWLGTQGGHVCSYEPARKTFGYLGRCGRAVVALAPTPDGACWALTAEGRLHQFHSLRGQKDFGPLSPGVKQGIALAADGRGWVYALVDEGRPNLLAATYDEIIGLDVKRLGAAWNLEDAKLAAQDGQVVLTLPKQPGTQRVCLEQGRASDAAPASAKPVAAGWQWQTDFDAQPPVVQVRKAASDPWKTIPIRYSKANVDIIRTLMVSKDGNTLYGSNWPIAWVWQMDLATGRIRRVGQDYNWYAMREVDGGVVYAIGYFGIKLLRWDPSKPWTMDRVDANPGRDQTWGRRDCNPYFVTNFRFFRYMNVRRPAGLAKDAFGRLYTGGHTAAFSSGEETRTSGALFWYDPAADEIGVEPLAHSHVFDVCSVGDYVAVGTRSSPFPYEPPPENPTGGFFLFDTRTRKMARFEDAVKGGSVRYVKEALPGILVGAGNGGAYGDGAFLFIYDTRRLATTHVIKMPGYFPGSEYQTREMFRCGPDRRIYFYTVLTEGEQKQAVLFRLDAASGKVEAVGRGHGLSDAGLFIPGPALAFGPDRVFFASDGNLTSVPLETIVGKGSRP